MSLRLLNSETISELINDFKSSKFIGYFLEAFSPVVLAKDGQKIIYKY